jgi:hypothetical protein
MLQVLVRRRSNAAVLRRFEYGAAQVIKTTETLRLLPFERAMTSIGRIAAIG